MINNDRYMGYKTINSANNVAQQLAKQTASVNKWKMADMEGNVDPDSFAAKLKRADEYEASGEHCGATDSIAIVLRQMDEPTATNPVTKDFWHNGARVSISRDFIKGDLITIGGSASPDWIYVSTSVGSVKIDLNDMTSLMKCLDLFSPEDINAILKRITEVKQAREALNEIDRMKDELMKNDRVQDEDGTEDGREQSVSEAVGVVSAEEMRGTEEKREKKFVG